MRFVTEHSGNVLVESSMKITSLIVLFFLAGCATKPSLEQLEDEAMISGDWSAVEEHEQSPNRLGSVIEHSCPSGQALICVKNGLREACECVKSRTIL